MKADPTEFVLLPFDSMLFARLVDGNENWDPVVMSKRRDDMYGNAEAGIFGAMAWDWDLRDARIRSEGELFLSFACSSICKSPGCWDRDEGSSGKNG